jgi:hypothetical protein
MAIENFSKTPLILAFFIFLFIFLAIFSQQTIKVDK